MSWGPAARAGVVAWITVVETTVRLVAAAPSNETEAPAWKLRPTTVTSVPPVLAPLLGAAEVTSGAGAATTCADPPVCWSRRAARGVETAEGEPAGVASRASAGGG